jgi:hypothetical protein
VGVDGDGSPAVSGVDHDRSLFCAAAQISRQKAGV